MSKYRELSNRLTAAIDTQNVDEVASVLADARESDLEDLDGFELNDLELDAAQAGYDL